MNNQTRKKIVALLTAGALSVPFATAWGAPASQAASGNLAAYMQFGKAGNSAQTARVVQLTDAEVRALGLPGASAYSASALQTAFASPAFQRVWQRTDQLVASGAEKRSWYWGPAPNTGGLQEDYAEGVGGKRLVQYFDKSRMEINDPNADPNSPFYVTNGLLTVELISGKMQVGNSTYVDRWSADIPLASDPDDPNAPTYLSFRNVSNTPLGDHPANSAMGQPVTATIARDGAVGNDPTKSSYPDANVAYFEPTTKHNIAKAIWDFLNLQGPVLDPVTGKTTVARLSDPWFYATGYPISEGYWARVKIAGQQQDVLIQAFERRIVTYVPNGVPGFKVQMGNIGQHYYDWRYKDAGKPAGGTPIPVGPTATPRPVNPTPTTVARCDQGVPDPKDATVTPKCGPIGTVFSITAQGFTPSEQLSFWLTMPDGEVLGTPRPVDIGNHPGSFQDQFDSSILGDLGSQAYGIWAITYEGAQSHHQSIVWFKITAPAGATPTPTAASGSSSCADVPASQNATVTPNCGPRGTRFEFTGRGFRPGEGVSAYITFPDQSVCGPPQCAPAKPFQANSDGTLSIGLTVLPGAPIGIWATTMEGLTTHNKAIAYFKVIP